MISIRQLDYRNRSIVLAVMTSIASKAGTLLLRLISIPLAVKVLGLEEFGVYTAITIIVAMVDSMQVGIGPAVTQRLSKAVSEDDQVKQRHIVATSMGLSLLMTTTLGIIVSTILWTVPIQTLFGEEFAPFAGPMKQACWVALAIVCVEAICVLIDRARDGYLETRISNLWGAAGNFTGAITLFFGIAHFPNLIFLVLAVNGSIALAKLGNTIHFFLRRRFLLHCFRDFQKALIRPLLLSGGVFTITYTLSAVVEHTTLIYLVGRFLDPATVGTAGILATVHFSANGLLQMFTTPMWPALINARSRGDYAWIRQAGMRLRTLAVLFGAAMILGMAFLGEWFFPIWIDQPLAIGRYGMITFALFFAAHIWRHANQVIVIGFDQENWVARVIALESTIVLTVIVTLLATGCGLSEVYLGIACTIVAITGWALPMRFHRLLNSQNEQQIATPIGSTVS